MRTMLLQTLSLAIGLLWLSTLPLRADDWPLVYHDPANTSVSADRLALPLRLAWQTALPVAKYAPAPVMVACRGRVFVANGTAVSALDLRTGKRLWSVPGHWSSLCVAGDQLLVAENVSYVGERARLARIDQASGSVAFTVVYRKLDRSEAGIKALTAYQGRVYAASSIGKLVEIRSQDGRFLNTASVVNDGWSMGLPAFRDGVGYWGASHNTCSISVPALRVRLLPTHDAGNCFPILWRDYLCLQGWNNWATVCKLTPSGLQPLYTVYGRKGEVHAVAPAGGGRLLQVQPFTDYLVAYRLATGKQAWVYPTLVTGRCIATADQVIALGNHRRRDRRGIPVKGNSLEEEMYGVLYVLEARTGRMLWRWRCPHSFWEGQPIIADRRVLAAAADTVYCFASK